MKISSNVTMMGLSRDALYFYKDIFCGDLFISDFSQNANKFGGVLPDRCNKFVFHGTLIIRDDSGNEIFNLNIADSPVMIFQEELSGNRDNITFEIIHDDSEWIINTYNKLLTGGKSNLAPNDKESIEIVTSLIDRYGVCWILKNLPSNK